MFVTESQRNGATGLFKTELAIDNLEQQKGLLLLSGT